jgi:hypothetical protein
MVYLLTGSHFRHTILAGAALAKKAWLRSFFTPGIA